MNIYRPLLFVLSRLISPLGLIVQTALLARALDPAEFARFLNLYAVAVIASAISDGGGRLVFFAEERRAYPDPNLFTQILGKAISLKVLFSTGLFVALSVYVSISADGLYALYEYGAALLLGVTMPVGDVYLTALRAAHRPQDEVAVTSAEQVVILAILYYGAQISSWTVPAALAAVGGVGAVRMLVARLCLSRLRIAGGGLTISGGHRLRVPREWIKISVLATASVVLTQLFQRYPALSLLDRLEPQAYGVFIAFLTLTVRGQVFLQGLLQAWYGTQSRLWRFVSRSAMSLTLASALFAIVVVGLIAVFPNFWVRLYLGGDAASAAHYARYAAVIMLLAYPLFVLSIMLQYENRHKVVILGAAGGLCVQAGLVYTSLGRQYPVLPYALGVLTYFVVAFAAATTLDQNIIGEGSAEDAATAREVV